MPLLYPLPDVVLSFQPAFINPGDQVVITAVVHNGTSPFSYLWERKDQGEANWQLVREITDSDFTNDQVTVIAGNVDFYIRCTVQSGGNTIMQTILLRVAE